MKSGRRLAQKQRFAQIFIRVNPPFQRYPRSIFTPGAYKVWLGRQQQFRTIVESLRSENLSIAVYCFSLCLCVLVVC